jgi:hypothetical protein
MSKDNEKLNLKESWDALVIALCLTLNIDKIVKFITKKLNRYGRKYNIQHRLFK